MERITNAQRKQLKDLLLFGDQSYDDLVRETGLSKERVAYFMRTVRGEVRISGYGPDKNGRLFVRLFSWGSGPDEPRPGRTLTAAEQMRKLRARRRAEAEAEQ